MTGKIKGEVPATDASSTVFVIPANFNVTIRQGMKLTVGNFSSHNINCKCHTTNKHTHLPKMQGDTRSLIWNLILDPNLCNSKLEKKI